MPLRIPRGHFFFAGIVCYNSFMQKLTAIILAWRDVGEFDRLYFLYTREAGLVRVIGRGARKPAAKLAGHLEPGTLSEVYVARSRGRGQIASAITLENFESVKKNFEKLEPVLEIFRFFSKNFSEEEGDERIFNLLLGILRFLDSGEKPILPVEAFWWKLFDFLGNRPETMKCARCSSKLEEKNNFFSVKRGGVVCQKCSSSGEELAPISENQIKLVRVFLANPLESIGKLKIDEKELGSLRRIREEFGRYNF